MADAYTSTTAVSNAVVTAYDKAFEFSLRAQPTFRSVADKRPVNVTNPGESVVFNIYADLAPATTPLTETVDPDAVALSNTSQVTVTLYEYGNAALITRRLELDSLSDVDMALVNAVAFNQVDSLDVLAQAKLAAGTQTLTESAGSLAYLPSGSAAPTLTGIVGTDTIKSRDVRFAVAQLRTNKVLPRKGSLYWCGIHPQVSADLRAETGSGGWRQPHEYNSNGNIWAGEVGEYEGAYFVESPRNTNTQAGSGAGASQIRVFNTYFAGQQALAEAVNQEPGMVIGEVTDKLRRRRPIGWYGMLGWSVFRQDAVIRLSTAASMRQTT
jgi:N4-gp56 family major capsid protein